MAFAWIDEWFKRTWIADPLDYNGDSRILWHNLASAEQNFGLVGFQKPLVMQNWESFAPGSPVTLIKAGTDYDFFHLRLDLANAMTLPDTLWIAFDTYAASLGESVLPNGQTVGNRAEFALRITNYSAELYVTQAYDLFGIWHNVTTAAQVLHSTITNGAPWNIVRVRNNNTYSEVQYIGNLQVNKGGLMGSSKDAVTIYDDHIDIRLLHCRTILSYHYLHITHELYFLGRYQVTRMSLHRLIQMLFEGRGYVMVQPYRNPRRITLETAEKLSTLLFA